VPEKDISNLKMFVWFDTLFWKKVYVFSQNYRKTTFFRWDDWDYALKRNL